MCIRQLNVHRQLRHMQNERESILCKNRQTDGEPVNLFDMRLTYTLLLQYDKLNALFAHRPAAKYAQPDFWHCVAFYRTTCTASPSWSCSHRYPIDEKSNRATHWQQLENLFTITLTTGNENSIRLVLTWWWWWCCWRSLNRQTIVNFIVIYF